MFVILIFSLCKLLYSLYYHFERLFYIVLLQIHGELVIKPSETSLTRDQYKSFVALCTSESNSRVTGWRSPQQKDISGNENDRYMIDVKKKII
jgi:hypothetical protein